MSKPSHVQRILLAGLIFIGFGLASCRLVNNSQEAAVNSEEEGKVSTPLPPQIVLPPPQVPTTAPVTETAVPTVTLTPTPLSKVTAVPDSIKESENQLMTGVGVLGGSNSDEYRGNDDRGGEYAKTTLGWVEQLVKSRDLNFGDWGEWGEPRRAGFAYNWARSGATTHEMIESGQHTGLALQIAAGEVSHALIFIGSNDFSVMNGTYKAIYDGDLDDAAVQAKVDQITTDITTAVDTLLAAGDVKLGIVLVADSAALPGFQTYFPDAAKRQRVTSAINAVNERILAMAADRGIVVIDIDKVFADLIARLDADGNLNFDGEKITLFSRGNEPHSGQLDDETGHLGTVMSGYLANEIFIEPFNAAYGLEIRPLTEPEMLQNAGIR